MSIKRTTQEEARLRVENIGGIEVAEVQFPPGITILEGRNATNRTSLLQGVMAAFGSDNISIKGDADSADVELSIGEKTYTRRLTRTGETIQTSGDPYFEDSTLADLFAFLLESNEARRAVALKEDLREIIMRPIDMDAIQEEVQQLLEYRREIDTELDEIESLKGKLPGLEEERRSLQSSIEEKEANLRETEVKIDSTEAKVAEAQEPKTEFEVKLEELGNKRSALEDVRHRLETERERLVALEREQEELRTERGDLQPSATEELDELDSTISNLREGKQALETEINELQAIIGFNEELLATANNEVFGQSRDGSVTDELLEDAKITCWTCGSEVERSRIRSSIERLRELSSEKFEEVSTLDDRLDEMIDERQNIEETRQRLEEIDRRLDEFQAEIEAQADTIADLEERRDRVDEEVRSLEEDVENLETESNDEVLDLHKRANELEYEIGRFEAELENVEDEISNIEADIARQESLEDERANVQSSIGELRTKIERIERGAVEEFNEQMDTVLELLDYRNLDRIWLERIKSGGGSGDRGVGDVQFELHIIRRTDAGNTYEDTVDHLSESEREVTGLVFALAGYLVHDLHEVVPFMLLDSLEAIDSKRIASLIEYLADYSDYLVAALLVEDAAALEGGYHRLTNF